MGIRSIIRNAARRRQAGRERPGEFSERGTASRTAATIAAIRRSGMEIPEGPDGDFWRAAVKHAERDDLLAEGVDPHQVDEQYWPVPGAAPCTNPDHEHTGARDAGGGPVEGLDYETGVPGRTEAEILADYSEGRIDRADYERQVDARYAAMDADFAAQDEETARAGGYIPGLSGAMNNASGLLGALATDLDGHEIETGHEPVDVFNAPTVLWNPAEAAARTMTDIVNDYNEGRIGWSEYLNQRAARAAQLGSEAFNDEKWNAPQREPTDAEINHYEAAEEQRVADSWGGVGPDYEAAAAAHDAAQRREPTPEGHGADLGPMSADELARLQGDFAELGQDERDRYLGDRAAEVAEGSARHAGAVTVRMLRDGATPDDVLQVLQTGAVWGTTAQAQPSEPETDAQILGTASQRMADEAVANAHADSYADQFEEQYSTGPRAAGDERLTDAQLAAEAEIDDAASEAWPGFLAAPEAEAAERDGGPGHMAAPVAEREAGQ
jgi:hypothetical protein